MELNATSPPVQHFETQEVQVYKLVLLGSSDVGKSCMVIRYVKDQFQNTVPTTGCAFFTQNINIMGKPLEFAIWDTAGQERYHSVCHLYYRGASAAMLVYDITRKETFSRAQLWLQELERYFPDGELVTVLVGNKSDLQAERNVPQEEGRALADSKGLLFMEASAKTGDNVCEAFEALGYELLSRESKRQERERKRSTDITIRGQRNMSYEGRNCCKS
ncbi:ras-related protein Rab-17 [Spea bombifrons]|uniref:ras-related protein Rab-17 n=1 Tax=Spea bombifrons TaxID=233779 RepID=UPI0023497461|nr:ras-related protein Rab-17 [Spea bombifrons]